MANPNQEARSGRGRYVRTLKGAQRDAEACRLRSQGWTYQRIAEHLGYTDKSNCRRAIEKVLKDTVQEPSEELRRMERERLDRLSEAAWEVLERQHVTVANGRIVTLEGEPLPDDGPVLAAIDRLLRISESRRKLEGLDAPSRVSVDAESLGAEIIGFLDRLGGSHGDSP